MNYIDLFSDGTAYTVTLPSDYFSDTFAKNVFANVASQVSPKLTLRIHGTTVFNAVSAAGLINENVLEIQVASNLVQAYKDSTNWYVIDDNKFVALHD